MHTICHFYINFAEKKNPDFEDSRWFKVIAEGNHAYFKLIDIFVAELFIPRHEICRLILCVKIDKWCLRVIDIFIQRLNNVQAKRTLKKFWEECNEQAQIYCNSTMHCWLFAVVVFIFIFCMFAMTKHRGLLCLYNLFSARNLTELEIFYRKNKMAWTGSSQLVPGPKNKSQVIYF